VARHFGWDKSPKPASAAEATAYLLDRGLRAQGVVSLDSICHLDAPNKKAIRRLIEQRVRRKELVPVGARRRRQAGALDAPGAVGRSARRGFRAGAHPLAVRSPDHPAQADGFCSSITSTALRPMCRKTSAGSKEELDKFESSQHFASQELIIVWLEVRVPGVSCRRL
jgi:hypothetical protein